MSWRQGKAKLQSGKRPNASERGAINNSSGHHTATVTDFFNSLERFWTVRRCSAQNPVASRG